MSSEVPEGWRAGNLVEFFELQRGFDLPVQERREGIVPVMASNGIVGRHDTSILQGPGVITGRSGSIGNVNYVEEAYWPLNTTLYVKNFKGNEPKFVFYFLQQFPLKDYQSGTGVPTLNRNDVHAVQIAFPPLDEQRRIAKVLRSVDEAIKATAAEHAGVRDASRSLIEEHILVHDGEGRLPIGDFAMFVGSGVTPKGGKEAYVDKGVALIRSQNVHFDGLRAEGLAFIDEATDAKMARTRVRHGDVLLNITGASIGRCTVVPEDFGPANVNQHVCIIRPDPAVVLPSYLSIFLSSWDGQRQIDQLQGGLSREGLNFQQVRAIRVPCPPLEVQRDLAGAVNALRTTMRLLERDLSQKEGMRKGITADLLSGRVRVPA